MFASRKRGRAEEEDVIEEYAHVNKQCRLPFRTSPTSKHNRSFSQSRRRPSPLFTQTITPADSSEEETSPPFSTSHSRPQDTGHLSTTTQLDIFEHFDMNMNMDTDMETTFSSRAVSPCHWTQDIAMSSPKNSPSTTSTISFSQPTFRDPFRPTSNDATGGRLPTPRYGHFQQSIEAKTDIGEDPENIIHPARQQIEYENYVMRRRLPTPIDEDEVMDGEAIGRMAMDTGNYDGRKASHGFPPPPRSARLSFSMGIRADCDLCRMKVPGHSNHIFKA